MDLPQTGKLHTDKAIQDSRKKPTESKLPLRDQARGTVYRTQRVIIDDSTFDGKVTDE